MVSREPRTGGAGGSAEAFDPNGAAGSLSWELGHRLIADGSAPVVYERRDPRGDARCVRAYAVTDNTCVVAVRSPVGREKFYEVPRAAFD